MNASAPLAPFRNGVAAAVLAATAGCSAFAPPRVEVADTTPPPAVASAPPPLPGAIYQAAAYHPLFEDRRARAVGDTLTVQIAEKLSATASSTSSIDKSGDVSASVGTLPFMPSRWFDKAHANGSSNNTFSGKGATRNSNDFTGTVTVIVREVLPNGNLVVAGEKQIGVNDNVDVLRFSGQVDPRAIQPGNVVASTQIANVRLEQRGRGAQADAQVIGWLARFFLSVLPI